MSFDVVAALRHPEITIADLERMRDKACGRPDVSEWSAALAAAAQAEIDRRESAE